MSASLYLDMLDQFLRPGIVGLSDAFVDAQVRFVADSQQADGGFRGRQGGSDLYYTDFAVRVLTFLARTHAAVDRATNYLAHPSRAPRGVIECFNVLNACRLLTTPSAFEPALLLDQVRECLLPHGGLARSAGDDRTSAYHTFLGSLCFQLLGVDMPTPRLAIDAIEGLKQPDCGFVELAGQTASQTSATAAAVAFLTMRDAISPEAAAGIARFLAGMQSADGGLKPHAAVEGGDLLSTFTGLLTLAALDGLHLIDLAGVARFLRNVSHPGGGFVSCANDDTADVEYTYYGIGTLALLRAVQP